jgi:hypothetical protein
MLHRRRLVWGRGVLTTMILFTAALLAHATPAAATHAPGTSCTPGREVDYKDWTLARKTRVPVSHSHHFLP